jgi:hypothetical protein
MDQSPNVHPVWRVFASICIQDKDAVFSKATQRTPMTTSSRPQKVRQDANVGALNEGIIKVNSQLAL